MEYNDFIKKKVQLDRYFGFRVTDNETNDLLLPHQRDVVKWACLGGRRAIFASFGLGKTLIQLQIMRIIHERFGGKQLIVAPLGVRQEFKIDAKKIGLDIDFVRFNSELGGEGIYITNYESIRDGRLSPDLFTSASLDEASVLRSFGSKTYQTFLPLFANVKYRFAATAVPSPNRYKELIHYAGYLGIMDTGQALTRFFKRDSQKANQLTLYPHKEKEFWLWVSSWGLFLQKPSDLGHSDEGYELPGLKVFYHKVNQNLKETRDTNGQLIMFPDASLSLKDASREKRDTIGIRSQKMLEILSNDPESHYILWHDQEKEREAIKNALPEAVQVYGTLDIEKREQRIIDFSDGKFKYLSTKPVLSGSGCNFQRHCHKAIFLGIGFKFNDFIQSIHRIYRFLQKEVCEIHIIYADSESGILDILKKKWKNYDKMVGKMQEIIKKYGLSNIDMENELRRSIGCERIQVKGDNFIVANNDCVEETKLIESNSVGLIHTSIPFANHYEYSPSYNDFGHTENNDHFWQQMDYLIPELYRVLEPGRIAAIHCKDRVVFGNVTGLGFPTMDNMHEETSYAFQRHGFKKVGMITVVTDVVRENNQTYRLGWSEQCKDGSKMGVGCPEYILIFRKPQTDTGKGYADTPVEKSKKEYSRARWQVDAHAFWRSSGDRLLTPDELADFGPDRLASLFTEQSLKGIYNYESHVTIGERLEARGVLPSTFMAIAPGSHNRDVWHDILRMNTLNGSQSKRGLNLHICPLQIDIVNRIITRYSNEGDWVYDPFNGIGTVTLCSIKLKRKGRGAELNTEYFFDSVKYLEAEELKEKQLTLEDYLKAVGK